MHRSTALAAAAREAEPAAEGCLAGPGCEEGGEEGEEAQEADWLQFSLIQTSLHITRERGHPKHAAGRDSTRSRATALPPVAAAQQRPEEVAAAWAGEVREAREPPPAATVAKAAAAAAVTAEAATTAPPMSALAAAFEPNASVTGGRAEPPERRRKRKEDNEAEGSPGGLLRVEAWLAHQVRSGGMAALHWLGGLAAGNHTSGVALSSTASRILNLAFDPARSMIDGVPILLICSLAFVIGLVFVIQVLGWSLEGKDMMDDMGKGGVPRAASRYGPAGGAATYQRAGSSPYAGPASAYQTLGPPSSSYMPMPHTADLGSFGSTSNIAPHTLDSLPRQGSMAGAADGQTLVDRRNALCPALILPQMEAQFSISAEAIRKLGLGQFPVQILGPSGRPLLHAHLPTQPVGGALASIGSGRWLELTTTATSRHPHACIGPLPLGSPSQQPLEIRGPRGDAYGTLEPQANGWVALKGGLTVLRLEFGKQGALHAYSEDKGSVPGIIATATLEGSQALRVQVNSGVDALLTLLCIIAVVLMTPDLAGARVQSSIFAAPGANSLK